MSTEFRKNTSLKAKLPKYLFVRVLYVDEQVVPGNPAQMLERDDQITLTPTWKAMDDSGNLPNCILVRLSGGAGYEITVTIPQTTATNRTFRRVPPRDKPEGFYAYVDAGTLKKSKLKVRHVNRGRVVTREKFSATSGCNC